MLFPRPRATAHSRPPYTPSSVVAPGIVWRQVLEVGDTVDRLLVAGRMLVTLSSHGKYLRAWSMKDGNLLWEVILKPFTLYPLPFILYPKPKP
jgi:hypothetical protein